MQGVVLGGCCMIFSAVLFGTLLRLGWSVGEPTVCPSLAVDHAAGSDPVA